MCHKCNNTQDPKPTCPCTETQEVTYICNECQPNPDCECAVKDLSTDCVTYTGDDLPCSGIKKNTILTELIQQLDAFICNVKDELQKYFTILNIGTGAKVYAGDNLLGNKKLRTISKTGDLITVTEATEEIVIGLDKQELEDTIIELIPNYNAENVGGEVEVFKDETFDTFNFRTLYSSDDSIEISQETDKINLKAQLCLTSSDETIKIIKEDDCFDLSVINPEIVNVGTGENLYKDLNSLTNQHEFRSVSSSDTSISITASTDDVDLVINNLQKTIDTFPYTLTDTDDKHTIFINNLISNVVINVPDTLTDNFTCVFIQKGTGEVTIEQSGIATLLHPTDLQNKIRGRNDWAMVEKELNTNNYYLIGRLEPL